MGARVQGLRLAIVAGIISGACVAEPQRMLTGQWGGRLIYLDARESRVQLRFPCMQAELPGLILNGAGHFEGTTRMISAEFAGLDPAAELRVTGEIAWSAMTLAVTYVSPTYTAPEPEHYTLRLGARPDFSGYLCPA